MDRPSALNPGTTVPTLTESALQEKNLLNFKTLFFDKFFAVLYIGNEEMQFFIVFAAFKFLIDFDGD